VRCHPKNLAAGLALALGACAEDAPPSTSPAPAAAAYQPSYRPSAPRNVVLILIDTLRADAVLDPAGRYDTPNLDRLGQDGAVFPRTFSSAPMTLPSHVSLFSSRPPFETHVLNNWQAVPEKLPLLAEWLGDHGYDTRGVISLGTLNPPPDGGAGVGRGFASYDHEYWSIAQANETHGRLLRSLERRDATKPLFLFAHYSDPHEPYNAHGSESTSVLLRVDGKVMKELPTSDESLWQETVELPEGRTLFEFVRPEGATNKFRLRQFEVWEGDEKLDVTWESAKPMDRVFAARVSVDRKQRARGPCLLRAWVNDVPPNDDSRRNRYALEVQFVDRYVGELRKELERLGLWEESLVVFTSDHGEALGEERFGKRFFGHAEGLTDEQIHVPLIVKLPRSDPRGPELASAAARLTTHLDLTPTILEIAGAPPLPGQLGHSLFQAREVVHVAQTNVPEAPKNQLAMRDERFKLIYFPEDERFELYDLQQDPGETTDVFAARASERKTWPERLHRLYLGGGTLEGGSSDDVRDGDMLRALGYGGGGDEADEGETDEGKDSGDGEGDDEGDDEAEPSPR
jgi:arylsulfatase A-like enzyme